MNSKVQFLQGEFFARLSDDDRILVSRILDLTDLSERHNLVKYTNFLEALQSSLAVSVLNRLGASYMLWGGYPEAERKILAVFPDGYADENDLYGDFPITALSFSFRTAAHLSHRDFLGSFMSKRISRELTGDIIVNEGTALAFVSKTAGTVIINECVKIGSEGVKISLCEEPAAARENNFIEINGTVPSLRIDCIISLALKVSREKSAGFIKSNLVSVRYANINTGKYDFSGSGNELSPSKTLSEGDVFSVRGKGKFILYSVGNKTKKDRFHVIIKKYV